MVDPVAIAVSTIAGFLLRIPYEIIRDRWKFRRELEDNSGINLAGTDWHAAWQTSVDHQVNVNTERLTMEQRGGRVVIWNQEKSPENPKGGYRWVAHMQFFHGRTLMGWYLPRPEENNTSRGIMYLSFQAPRKTFFGKWVGSNYDGDLSNGFVVISKDRTTSLTELQKLIDGHKDSVNIISSVLK